MINLKEEKIIKTIWHLKRYCEEILNSQSREFRGIELFHLQSCIECLDFIINNEKIYPNMVREDVN